MMLRLTCLALIAALLASSLPALAADAPGAPDAFAPARGSRAQD